MNDITGNYTLGPDSGRVLLHTGRAGLAAKAGHDLVLEVTQWSGQVTVPSGGTHDGTTVTAELDLGSLVVREGSGGAKPLSDKDRRDIEATARKILGGGAEATASFASSKVVEAPSGDGGAIEGSVTLRGQTRPARLDVTRSEPGQFRVTATVKQTEFGITPYSGFFGTLKLRDEIGVEVDIRLGQG